MTRYSHLFNIVSYSARHVDTLQVHKQAYDNNTLIELLSERMNCQRSVNEWIELNSTTHVTQKANNNCWIHLWTAIKAFTCWIYQRVIKNLWCRSLRGIGKTTNKPYWNTVCLLLFRQRIIGKTSFYEITVILSFWT